MAEQDDDRLSWASLRPKLARLLDSPSPHIRANLATLAASMSSDPDALDELASIGADAADSIAADRGDLRDVLSTVLAERDNLDELERKRFDQFFATRLKREAKSWKPSQLAALLRKGLPIQLLPLKFVRDAVCDACISVPVETRTPQDIRDLQDQRSRLEPVIAASRAPGAERSRSLLVASIHQRLSNGDEKQRDAVLFGLLELWPEMAQDVSRGTDDQEWLTLVPAARMRRVGRRRLAGPLAVNLLAFCMVAFAIPRLGGLLFPSAEVAGTAGWSLIAFFSWSLVLALIGFAASLPVLFLYTPTAILPASPLMRLRINAPPVIGGALFAAFVFFFSAIMSSTYTFVLEGFVLVLLLLVVAGGLMVITVPVLRAMRGRSGWYRRLINGNSAAALPLFASGVLLIVLQPGDPEFAALIWAFVLVIGMGMGVAAWLSESVPHGWTINASLAPWKRRLPLLSASALVLVFLVCLSPLAALALTNVRPIVVSLGGSRLEAPLREGLVYRINSGGRPYVVQVLHPDGYPLVHRLSVAELTNGKPGAWQAHKCTAGHSSSPVSAGLVDKCGSKFPVTGKGALVCYNCADKSGNLIEFVEAAWPFRMQSRVHVDARLLIDGRNLHSGDAVSFGEIRKFAVSQRACVQGQGLKLWRQGEASRLDEEAQDTIEVSDMVVDESKPAGAPKPKCPGVAVEPGQYSICYHAPGADRDCRSRAGARPAAVRPGNTVFRYTLL